MGLTVSFMIEALQRLAMWHTRELHSLIAIAIIRYLNTML